MGLVQRKSESDGRGDQSSSPENIGVVCSENGTPQKPTKEVTD